MHLIFAVVLLLVLGGMFLKEKAGDASYNAMSAAVEKAKESFEERYVDKALESKLCTLADRGPHSPEVWPEVSRALQEMSCELEDFPYLHKIAKPIMLANRGKVEDLKATFGYKITEFGSLKSTFILLNWMQETFQKQGLPLKLWYYKDETRDKRGRYISSMERYVWEESSGYEREKRTYSCKLLPFDYSIIADRVAQKEAPIPAPYYEQKNDGE